MGHYLLLITTTSESTTSAAVREEVTVRLENDPSFIGGGVDGCLFSIVSPLADYFSVGGWFSGYLIGRDDETGYVEGGSDDDAMLITPQLYHDHLKQWEGRTLADTDCVDFQGDVVSPDFIGRKYLVVIDFHQ